MGLKYVGLLVTGTDTGVGKTVVSGALTGALRHAGIDAGVMKPVQSGALETPDGLLAPDARFLANTSGVDDPPDLICPVRLRAPLAPSVAARLEGTEIDLNIIRETYRELVGRHSFVVVEGVGGLSVPIRDDFLVSDLARELGLPLLVVARPSLGTINHTLLTLHFARSAGLEVLGVIINNYPIEPGLAERTSPAVIERLGGVPVLGLLPWVEGVDVDEGIPGESVTIFQRSGILERLLPLLQH